MIRKTTILGTSGLFLSFMAALCLAFFPGVGFSMENVVESELSLPSTLYTAQEIFETHEDLKKQVEESLESIEIIQECNINLETMNNIELYGMTISMIGGSATVLFGMWAAVFYQLSKNAKTKKPFTNSYILGGGLLALGGAAIAIKGWTIKKLAYKNRLADQVKYTFYKSYEDLPQPAQLDMLTWDILAQGDITNENIEERSDEINKNNLLKWAQSFQKHKLDYFLENYHCK